MTRFFPFPLSFPTTKVVARITHRPTAAVAVGTSPFTFEQQAQPHLGQMWAFDVVWPAMERADAEEIVAFKLKLNGREGTFLMSPPGNETPRGTASSSPGTPLVDGANQTGDRLNIKGAPAGATGYLKSGDYIQLGTSTLTRLYKVLADVNTDSVGDATLPIWPYLRSSPADGATVVVSSAQGHFRNESNVMEYDIDTAIHYGTSLAAVEAL